MKWAAPGRWTAERARVLLRALLAAVALVVTGEVFWAAVHHLGPDSSGLETFNSDAAIPILMANQGQWGLQEAYYAGQDRFGAWPFWLAHVLGNLLHRPVTPQLFFLLATAFLASGVVPAMLLCRRAPGLAALAYAIALLAPETRGAVFWFQPYPWQISLLLWAWWVLRRAWAAKAPLRRAGWLACATVLSFLATWTSPLSGPLLLALTVVEGQGAKAQRAAQPSWRLLLLLSPALLAMVAEVALRLAYRASVLARFHELGVTHFEVDSGHLLANAGQVWLRLGEAPRPLLALLVLTGAGCLLLARRLRAGAALCFSPLGCTLLGAGLLALLPLPVLVAVRHVRFSEYLPRYFTLTHVFALFGALLVLTAWLPSRLPGWPAVAALAAGTAALGFLAQALRPTDAVNPDYARLQATAQQLAQRAPGALLLDGYWGTYVYAALAPPGQLRPLPRSGEWNRLPALEAQLAQAHQVLVGHQSFLAKQPGLEPPWLFQYGVLLVREEANFFSDGVDTFSSYRPTAVQALRFSAQPPLEGRHLEQGAVQATLQLEAPASATAVVVELSCQTLEALPRAWAEGPGEARLPVEVRAVPGAVFLLLPENALAQLLHLVFAPQRCRVRAVCWFVPPPGRPWGLAR